MFLGQLEDFSLRTFDHTFTSRAFVRICVCIDGSEHRLVHFLELFFSLVELACLHLQ